MMDNMMKQMAASMGGKMGPEGMVDMMGQMVESMFAEMTVDDKINFMQTMMGACMTNILDGLSVKEKQEVATTVLENLGDELKKHNEVI